MNVDVRANYLMSPPLVVAFALAGKIGHNFDTDPLGTDEAGKPVYLKDIWPTQAEVADAIEKGVSREGFRKEYATVADGDANWQGLSRAAMFTSGSRTRPISGRRLTSRASPACPRR